MSGRCIGEPVSWLRLERLHLGEISGPERARIEEHLAACRACAACLASIVEGDAQALPPLALPERRRRATLSFLPLRAAAVVGGLAAAAAVALSIRGGDHPLGSSLGQRLEGRIKGDAVAFSLVREDDERITGAEGVYRDGDRFKAVVTCPPGANLALDVVVYDEAGASFPLDPAPAFACGNQTPMEGAFRLTGAADETVCLVWKEGAPVDRGPLSARAAAGDTSSCKRLHASTGRR